MKCHYEVLGVSRDADDNDIKSAYRKLALRWHPDKNLDQVDEAKDQFQLVAQAYEILSDPHERAWYDNHREQILRGRNTDYEENCLDLFQYFTISCYKGYGDDPGGFYGIYSDVFEKIAAEDAEFIDDDEKIKEIPTFGNSQSGYDDVVGPFYAYWQSYCTKKSYAWLCPYNISEIKDRRILREIDKDMKKIVQKARRERNDEVRNLVAFVRKRDKRVLAYKKYLEEKAAANRLKQEQNRLDQIRRRNEEMEEQKRKQGNTCNKEYEEQLRQLEQEYVDTDGEISGSDNDDENNEIESTSNLALEDSLYIDDLYCVACNKTFKNNNAFLNHETSKKHRENVEKLKIEMQHDEKQFEFKEESASETSDNAENAVMDNIEVNLKKEKKNKRDKRNKVNIVQDNDETVPDILTEFEKENHDWTDDKKMKKSKSKKNIQKKTPTNQQTSKTESLHVTEKPQQKDEPDIDIGFVCITCKSSFESKNKLFTHLKKTEHGVYIPKSDMGQKPIPAGNKKSRKNK